MVSNTKDATFVEPFKLLIKFCKIMLKDSVLKNCAFCVPFLLLISFYVPAQNHESDREKIVALYAERVQMETTVAYEKPPFSALIESQRSHPEKFKYEFQIKDLNIRIAKIESEQAAQANEKSIAKLELKRKALILERSEFEILDAPVLSNYAQAEFDKEMSQATEMYAELKDKIEKRTSITDEIKSCLQNADILLRKASKTAANRYSSKDVTIKDENCRLTFAIEILAIDHIKQATDIMSNLDLLLKYTDDEITAMRKGDEVVQYDALPEEKSSEEAQEEAEPIAELVAVVVKPAEAPAQIGTIPIEKAEEKEKPVAIVQTMSTAISKEHKHNEVICVDELKNEVFYTVQFGAFSKPIDEITVVEFGSVYRDKSTAGITKYTAGHFKQMDQARQYLDKVRAKGITDAFITAYSNGKRITVSEAVELLSTIE